MQNSSSLVFCSFIYGLIAPEKLITNTYFLFQIAYYFGEKTFKNLSNRQNRVFDDKFDFSVKIVEFLIPTDL